ncbi:alcohol acetyltransferase-domain-containing protein [Nemania sp. NC0429]|nr:alcohol acetyltransferase-domain-containing protein [Nemania sp. NC0429]
MEARCCHSQREGHSSTWAQIKSKSYQIALQNLDQIRANILTYRYKIPSDLVSPERQRDLMDTFERAIAQVILKHPVMHIGLVGENTNKPCWVRLDRMDLQKHIQWLVVDGGATDFHEVFLSTCYRQLDNKFADYLRTPGWRVKVLRKRGRDFMEVLLVLNHTNMDGGSAKIFHRDLLQNLHDDPQMPRNDLLRDHILTLPENSTATLSPPAEDLVQFPMETREVLKSLQEEVHTPAVGYLKTPTQAHWGPIKAASFKPQFRTITITHDVLAALLKACRHHNTTLTGLLHAFILVSLAPILEPSGAAGFRCLTAMDLRRFLPSNPLSHPWSNPEDAMGNHVTIVDHVLSDGLVAQIRSKASLDGANYCVSRSGDLMALLWSVARGIRREIEQGLETGLKNDMIGDWRAQSSEEARKPRRTSWVITNLGSIGGSPIQAPVSSRPVCSSSSSLDSVAQERDSQHTWSFTRAQFIMCANVVSSAFGIATASVKDGDFIITCTWQDCVIDVHTGDAFVDNLESWLNFAARYRDGWPAPGRSPIDRPVFHVW